MCVVVDLSITHVSVVVDVHMKCLIYIFPPLKVENAVCDIFRLFAWKDTLKYVLSDGKSDLSKINKILGREKQFGKVKTQYVQYASTSRYHQPHGNNFKVIGKVCWDYNQ